MKLGGKKVKLRLLPKASSGSGGASKNAAEKLVLPSPFFAKVSEPMTRRVVCGVPSEAYQILKNTPLRPKISEILEGVFEASPFGHGGQTVLDESVRKAMQVRQAAVAATACIMQHDDTRKSRNDRAGRSHGLARGILSLTIGY